MDYIYTGCVFVTFDFVGFHRWPEAPDEVRHLRDRHRHLFKVRADVSVEHASRAIEFQLLKREMIRLLKAGSVPNEHGEHELGSLSCEMIANIMANGLKDGYPDRPYYRVEVSEDGENGAIVEMRA